HLTVFSVLLFLPSGLLAASPVEAPRPLLPPQVGPRLKLPAALGKPVPSSVQDLGAIERHVQSLLPRLSAATVGIRAGRAQGSGVIVSPDGYVLTAGHVSATAGRDVQVTFPDGKRVKARTLGAFHTADAGLIKITEKRKEPWPFIPVADMRDVKVGDWCLALGHPGGFQPGRPPVVRLGRVIRITRYTLQTDAVLVGGDSGGPVFDMHGRVLGINSRIGRPTTSNYHVTVSSFLDNWTDLVRGRVWGSRGPSQAVMGINGEDHPRGCKVTGVPENYPAAKAGIQVGDIITQFDGKPVRTFRDLVLLVSQKQPGDKVVVEILRNNQKIKVTVQLARR
ncbi:MAG: PDZ domain-containing protein, partial [Candidatus Zixiibacteriota bacterium]